MVIWHRMILYAFVICDRWKDRQEEREHQGCLEMCINSQVVKAHQKYICSKLLKQGITLCNSFRG